ncbi:MAG: UDP-3-O-acyl-N-acetylglucosamine deacetylase [Heliobacteriaceae bacterium]|jgi:UDP-3-O-[3-hydroxymyristoyl] N-acetylglucosamine deacetylase|nr:UDP-3-O-acyl-N-acetylglucosamine deacetylase [Heliobacteriaceae bacterium]
MTSLRKETEISGNGLMKNKPCTVKFVPSKTGRIRYFVKDAGPFEADVENVLSTQQCVKLGDGKSSVMLTEHLSAALAFCGIDEIDIHVNAGELPALDGSAKEWVDLFKKAGIEKTGKTRYYTVSEPVYYLNGKTLLVIVPDNELNITYSVNYDHPNLANRWVSLNTKHPQEIIEARTFGFYKDLKKFQTLGFAKGVTLENTVGLTDNKYTQSEYYTTQLRSEFEPVKHKILDLIGDLYLTGVNPLNLKAQIIAKEAGHAVHIKTAKMLKEKLIECK